MCVRERKTVNDKGVSSEEEAYSEEKAQESNRKRAESQAPHYINGGWSGWRERGWVDRLMFAWRLRRWGAPPSLRRHGRWFIKTRMGSNSNELPFSNCQWCCNHQEYVIQCTDVEFETSDVLAYLPCKHQSSSIPVFEGTNGPAFTSKCSSRRRR